MDELEALLGVPGMRLVLHAAPVVAAALWLLITAALWRGGFTDLTERLTRPRWAGPARIQALAMIPLRAVLLSVVAAIGAAMTTVGLVFNLAVIANLVNLLRNLGG